MSIKINNVIELKTNLNLGLNSILTNNDENYADDCNIFCPATNDALRKLLSIIKEFEHLSGLSINKDKTYVMILGSDPSAELKQIITSNGLTYTDTIKHLGFSLDNKLEKLAENCVTKIKKQNAWRISGQSLGKGGI